MFRFIFKSNENIAKLILVFRKSAKKKKIGFIIQTSPISK